MDIPTNTQLNWMVVSDEVSDVMELGIEKRWFFRIIAEKGVLQEPILKSDWRYVPVEADSTIIPAEGLRRMEAVKKRFSVKQVIIGHELVEVLAEPEIHLPKFPWKVAAAAVVGFAVVGVVGALAMAAVPVAAAATVATAALADPQLIIVLDDPESTWISIFEWLG